MPGFKVLLTFPARVHDAAARMTAYLPRQLGFATLSCPSERCRGHPKAVAESIESSCSVLDQRCSMTSSSKWLPREAVRDGAAYRGQGTAIGTVGSDTARCHGPSLHRGVRVTGSRDERRDTHRGRLDVRPRILGAVANVASRPDLAPMKSRLRRDRALRRASSTALLA